MVYPILQMRIRQEAEAQGYDRLSFRRACAKVRGLTPETLMQIWDGRTFGHIGLDRTIRPVAMVLDARMYPDPDMLGNPGDGHRYLYWWTWPDTPLDLRSAPVQRRGQEFVGIPTEIVLNPPIFQTRIRQEAEAQGYDRISFGRACATIAQLGSFTLRQIWADHQFSGISVEKTIRPIAIVLNARMYPDIGVLGDPQDGHRYLFLWNDPQPAEPAP